MKVLFAVNDENISTSIVKKYREKYKEIISYKNVYYFNAIIKELQRNKSYDRIVISEDLEEFTSSSVEQRDKFIFDRLDNISDEAVSTTGVDIPILLICSDRREKSEDILVRLFGISIYNAIIGADRSTDEVCRLINKPRSKKEAKNYYRIDSDKITYEKQSESDVSEVEMQNILMHFKKLRSNVDKYADSFSNIATQYNESQLKVIASMLPANVKSVLAETSPEFRQIMKIPGGIDKTDLVKASHKKIVGKKGPSEKLLQTEDKPIMSRPVVVPTTMEKNMYKKVEAKKTVDIEDIENEDVSIDSLIVSEEKPKRRGRPRKTPIPEEIETPIEKTQKRRGRPRKNPLPEEPSPILKEGPSIPYDEDEDLLSNSDEQYEVKTVSTIPGFEDEDKNLDADTILPGFDEDEDEDEYEEETDSTMLPGFGEQDDDSLSSNQLGFKSPKISSNISDSDEDEDFYFGNNNNDKDEEYREPKTEFDDYKFQGLLSNDKKIVAFVGTSKNGTSFIVNNIAQILSGMGINTAIFDATKNKNAYYIYTKNDEELRKTALNSIASLKQGSSHGVKANSNLTVYTTIPSQNKEIINVYPIMEGLVKNHSVVLIDCDFNTPIEYFDKAQEIYLIQSMDVLTIQPLTEFLRELKMKNVLDESKIRIILNKLLKIRSVTGKNIVGGMSNYNDPEMSFMTELFDRNTVRVTAQIPFDEDVYAKYLESIIECEIKINGYPKEFRQKLNELATAIYPLSQNQAVASKKLKKGKNIMTNSFSPDMNNTLDNMRKKY